MNKNCAHLEYGYFDCSGLFINIFTIKGTTSRERGPKKVYTQLHMVFRLLLLLEMIYKTSFFLRSFLLGLSYESVKYFLPDYKKNNFVMFINICRDKKKFTQGLF